MTLIARPRLIFLDEPTAGLDPRSRRDLWAIVREQVADGMTVLLTTQYLDEADQLADRIGVLDGGRLVAEGTAAELKRRVPGGHVSVRFTDAAFHPASRERTFLAGGRGNPFPGTRKRHDQRQGLSEAGDGPAQATGPAGHDGDAPGGGLTFRSKTWTCWKAFPNTAVRRRRKFSPASTWRTCAAWT